MKKVIIMLMCILWMSTPSDAQCRGNNYNRNYGYYQRPCGTIGYNIGYGYGFQQPYYQPMIMNQMYSQPIVQQRPAVVVVINNTTTVPRTTEYISIIYENGFYYQSWSGGKLLANGTFKSQSNGRSHTYQNGALVQ